MFKIQLDNAKDIDSFSMGHMIFCEGKASSKEKTPSQKMMVISSLPCLLDSLAILLSKRMPAVEFAAVDSSFSIIFSIIKNKNLIRVVHRKTEVGIYPMATFCETIHDVVLPILEKLDSREIIYGDLLDAFHEFNRLRAELSEG